MSNDLCGKYTVNNFSGDDTGTLTVSQKGLMTAFDCQCNCNTEILLKLAILSGGGYKIIGTMAPEGGKLKLNKKFSKNDLRQISLDSIEEVFLLTEEELSMPLGTSIFAKKAEAEAEADEETGAAVEAEAEREVETGTEAEAEGKSAGENAEIISQAFKETGSDPPQDCTTPICAVHTKHEEWRPSENPQELFNDEDLRKSDISGALEKTLENGLTLLAIPFETDEPFPVMPIFCFGEAMNIGGRNYLVFCLKDGELYM